MSAHGADVAAPAAGSSIGAAAFTPSVSEAEEQLQRLLKGWRSRYRHIILLRSADRRVVQFVTEWARRPTPMEPLPPMRVQVHFSFLYDAKGWARAGNTGPPPAQISYRIEQERTVYSGPVALKSNIDHHILRLLKFKGEFARRNPLPLTADQSQFFQSRLEAYEPLARVADSHLGSFVAFADAHAAVGEAGAGSVERELIAMFQRADFDQNGSLDPEEFEDLLINSKWGFTKEDVAVVMQQHDANDDGKLVYSEFIPIAIDLVQAQRASAHAQIMSTNITEAAYKSALARIQSSKELHRAMDAGLGGLDPSDSGLVPVQQLAELLRQLDLDLTEGEIAAILAKIRSLNKAASAKDGSAPSAPTPAGASSATIAYKVLQDRYEDLILDSIQKHHLDAEASDVEVYLNALFRSKDPEGTGILDEKEIASVLASNPAGVSLSSTQIYAILGDHKPLDGKFTYRLFARKAAHMIYELFDAASLSERSSMIRRSAITPIQLLGAGARQRIEHAMRAKLREFDQDGDGRLSPAEFRACLADTHLALSATEVSALLSRADTNGDGFVDLHEWIRFAYETLLHLQRDAALKAHMSTAIKQKAAADAEATKASATAAR